MLASELTSLFPHPTLVAHQGVPTYAVIAQVNLKLNANASAIETTLGNGLLGHLHLTVTAAQYEQLAHGVYDYVPEYPGLHPNYPAGANDAERRVREREHAENKRIWSRNQTVDAALRQLVIGCFDEVYLKPLANRVTGYGHKSTRQILDHLYTVYGQLSPADLAENDSRMRTEYDAALPIETLYEQIEDAQELAAAGGAPYSPVQVVNVAFNLVFHTGHFKGACEKWRERAVDTQTWDEFKIFFAKAHQSWLANKTTMKSAKIHAAAAAEQQEREDFVAWVEQQKAQEANSASAMTTKQDELASLLKTALAKIADLEKRNNNNGSSSGSDSSGNDAPRKKKRGGKDRKKGNGSGGNGSGGNGSSGNNGSGGTTGGKAVVTDSSGTNSGSGSGTSSSDNSTGGPWHVHKTGRRFNNNNYCHSHGYDVADGHTSQSCSFPHPGHCKEATRENNKGGSQKDRNLVM